MLRYSWFRWVAFVAAACTVATYGCATTSPIVTRTLVPEGAPGGRPQEGQYDRVSISCGTALLPEPLLVGRVVRRTPGGDLVPLLGVTALLETHGTVHAHPKPTPIRIEQDSAGHFSHRVSLSSDTLVYYKGDVVVGWEDVDDTATLTLQATGCEPLRVTFTVLGEEQLLEMRCAGDDAVPARDGPDA